MLNNSLLQAKLQPQRPPETLQSVFCPSRILVSCCQHTAHLMLSLATTRLLAHTEHWSCGWRSHLLALEPGPCLSSRGQGPFQILETLVSIKVCNPTKQDFNRVHHAMTRRGGRARVSGAGAPSLAWQSLPQAECEGSEAEWEAGPLRCTRSCGCNWMARSLSSR